MTIAPQVKPALLLDDDPSMVGDLSRGIRRFGGLPVEYYTSVEAFLQHNNLQIEDQSGLARVLGNYAAVVSDHDFQGPTNDDKPGMGKIYGLKFLAENAAPAIQNIPEQDRPMLICFAPSSPGLIKNVEQPLWEKFGIVSFHKANEAAAVGIDIRLARDYGVVLNRHSLIEQILRLPIDDDTPRGEKVSFFMMLAMMELGRSIFPNEDQEIAGEAKPIETREMIHLISKHRKIPPEILIANIDREVAFARSQGKERPRTSKEI